MHEVPKMLREFILIRIGKLNENDMNALKEWVGKDEAEAVHKQLEEFRDEAGEEKVVRRLNRNASSTTSWIVTQSD